MRAPKKDVTHEEAGQISALARALRMPEIELEELSLRLVSIFIGETQVTGSGGWQDAVIFYRDEMSDFANLLHLEPASRAAVNARLDTESLVKVLKHPVHGDIDLSDLGSQITAS